MQKKAITRHDKVVIGLTFSYIILICTYMIIHRIWFSPDQFFIFALFGTLIIGQIRIFIIDWIPFISLFLGYEYLRGLVPFVSKNVHIFPMINIDRLIFGFLPTNKFQSLLYSPSHLHWYDYVLVTFYISHFVVPMLVGFFFWLKDRSFFRQYALGLLILSYAAFITYIIFPAMPPWMAGNAGYIPPVKEVTGVVMSHFPSTTINLPSIYSTMRSNPVAAMPSLHAAFPTIIFLFALKKLRKYGLLFLPYVLGVWFAVIYLGEHYFIDVAVGIIYAGVAFTMVVKKDALFLGFNNLIGNRIKLAVRHLWAFNNI